MTLKAKKAVKAKIVFLTGIKRRLLEGEYNNLQRFLQGEDAELYSANKQQAKRFYKRIKLNKEYPLSIRKDLLKIEKRDTKIAQYWARAVLPKNTTECTLVTLETLLTTSSTSLSS